MTAKRHTLLFGGSFDPIHRGHLQTAAAALAEVRADRVLFIPAHLSPHKAGTAASFDHRLAMIRLAIGDQAGLAVSEIERLRPPPSYTIDTVTALQGQFPGDRFTLLMGADQLPKLHTWHRVGALLGMIDVAILPRPGVDADGAAMQSVFDGATVARLRGAILHTPLVDIASTTIRQRLAAGQPTADLLPPAVAAYIATHNLYRLVART